MTWASPWAWLLASGVVLPLVAHLWSRRRPGAVMFPTLRFLTATSPVSRRLHRIQDWPLLLLRLAIVLVISAAAAGPTLLAWRHQPSPRRLHRVIVVDQDVQADAAPLVARLEREAASATVVDPGPVPLLIDQAVALAEAGARTSRAEIAIIWNGTTPALTRSDLSDVPAGIGIRLHVVERTPPGTAAAPAPSFSIDAIKADTDSRDRVLARLSSLQVPASDVPLIVRWRRVAFMDSPLANVPAPQLRALDDVAQDVRMRDAADRSAYDTRRPEHDVSDEAGRWLARSPAGRPLLRGWVERKGLVIASDATPSSPLSWWSVVSPLEALVRWERLTSPTRAWSPQDIADVQRDAAPPHTTGVPPGHTRHAWTIALALLLLEQWWRASLQRGASADGAQPRRAEEHATDAP